MIFPWIFRSFPRVSLEFSLNVVALGAAASWVSLADAALAEPDTSWRLDLSPAMVTEAMAMAFHTWWLIPLVSGL